MANWIRNLKTLYVGATVGMFVYTLGLPYYENGCCIMDRSASLPQLLDEHGLLITIGMVIKTFLLSSIISPISVACLSPAYFYLLHKQKPSLQVTSSFLGTWYLALAFSPSTPNAFLILDDLPEWLFTNYHWIEAFLVYSYIFFCFFGAPFLMFYLLKKLLGKTYPAEGEAYGYNSNTNDGNTNSHQSG